MWPVVEQHSDAIEQLEVQVCSGSAHHWLIQSPDGPTCEGVCKWCGAHRVFASEAVRRYSSPGRPTQKPAVVKPSPLADRP
jgi:hypothetical protein